MHRRRRIKTHPTTHTRRNHHRIRHRTTHTDPIGEIRQAWSQVERNWRLDERHYGALQGLDKKQTTELHGSEQTHAWRRALRDDRIAPQLMDGLAVLVTVRCSSAPAKTPSLRHMASKKLHLDTLRSVALFNGCSTKELEKVAKASDEIHMTAGTLIVDQGQTGREAFVVLEGEVEVKRNNRKVATLGPGAVVGELSLLDHGPRTATAVCITDCTLLVVDQRRFLSVIDSVPAISHKLLAALAARIREMDRQYFG